jgi:prevent-host-death family protein
MVTIVDVHEAKARLSGLLERAYRGEEIVLAKAGKPYARLVPLETRKERVSGVAKGRVTETFFEPLSPEELDRWAQ